MKKLALTIHCRKRSKNLGSNEKSAQNSILLQLISCSWELDKKENEKRDRVGQKQTKNG